MSNAALWQDAKSAPFYARPDSKQARSGPGLFDLFSRIAAECAASHATLLNTFDDAVLIGSTVSVATFWLSSTSSLACPDSVSYWLRA
jgi:hypothetical protein